MLKALQADKTTTIVHRNYAAVCVELGEQQAAEHAMAKFMQLEPQATFKLLLDTSPLDDPVLLERIGRACITAGMPEG